jgi:hypothetical protein
MAFSAHVAQSSKASSPQTVLLVTITVDPSNVDEFIKGLHICYDRCVEEPECLSFEVFQSKEVPGRFRFLEIWSKDREWFETVRFVSNLGERLLRCTGPNEQAILRSVS